MDEENYREVMAYALRLTKNYEDAQDLTQSVFLTAHVKAHQFQNGTNYRAWLCTIAKHKFINKYRIAKRMPLISIEAMVVQPKELAMCDDGRESGFSDEILKALEKLNKNQAFIIRRHHEDGIRFQDIASELGIPFGTVMSRAARAYDTIRASLAGSKKSVKIKKLSIGSSAADIEYGAPTDRKVCVRCRGVKQRQDFYFNKGFADGLHCYCKSCMSRYVKNRAARRVKAINHEL